MQLNLFWKIVSSILLFCISVPAAANLQVSGLILERGTKKPISNVNIYILPEGITATTDAKGMFAFADAPQGEREWIIVVAGYKRHKQNYNYQEAKNQITIYIERESYVDLETTVIGKLDKKDPAKKTMDQAEFLKMPGSGGDPVLAIKNLPGAIQSYDANVAIQGSPPEDTKYLIEGHEIPFMFHFIGLNTVAVPETIQSVDYLSAGYGPEYGRASSGVINLNLRKPRTDRTHGMSFVDFTAAGGFMEGKLSDDGTESFFVGGRYSYLGEVLKMVMANDEENSDGLAFNTAPTYFDFNFSYHNELTGRSKFTLMALASRDRIEAASKSADDLIFSGTIFGQTEFFRVIPKYKYRISNDSSFETSLGAGMDSQNLSPGNQSLKLVSQRYSWRSDYENKFLSWYKLNAGTDFVYEVFDNKSRITSGLFSDDSDKTNEAVAELLVANEKGKDLRQGYFLRNEISLTDKITFTPNLRYDHYQLHNKGFLQPRGGILYKISQDSNIHFNMGLYYQPATPYNLGEGTGNPELNPSKSTHYALNYDYDFRSGSADGFTLSTGFFYKDLNDLVTSSSNQIVRNGELVPERLNNSGKGHVKGAQLMLRYKKGKAFVNLGYTYTYSRRIEEGLEFSSPQDQTHNLNLTGSQSWGNYTLSSRFRYVTGLPQTPVLGGIYYENTDTYLPIYGNKLSSRLKDFWQLDMRLDKKWIYDTWILSLYLDIQNITNNKNETELGYNFDYSQSAAAIGLPLLPTFGIKGEF